MLTVQRNENKIEIKVEVDVPTSGKWTYTFIHTASNVPEAGFVAGSIQAQLAAHIQAQREVWYKKGWHEKAGHKVKRNWFPRAWDWLGL